MECPNCQFVATPGEAAIQGSCPNCQRPYRNQPTPLNSDMEMRDMPEPGMEDSGGNPLQEGILGDYQNRGVRDESYASVKKSDMGPDLRLKAMQMQKLREKLKYEGHPSEAIDDQVMRAFGENDLPQLVENHEGLGPQFQNNGDVTLQDSQHIPWTDPPPGLVDQIPGWGEKFPNYVGDPRYPGRMRWTKNNLDISPDVEIPAEVTGILPPDPESIRPDKRQMDKQGGFLDDVAPVAGGLIGGAVGTLVPIPGVGTAAGAAIGAGLAGGGVKALEGGDVGDVAQTGLTDAALGGIGGGLYGGAAKMAGGVAADAAEQGATRGGIGSLMKSAWSKVPTEKIKNAYLMHSMMGDASQATQPMTQPSPGMMQPGQQQMSPSFYSAVETPTSHGEIPSNNADDPEEVDFHEKNDSEKDGLQSDQGINDEGGTDLGPDDFFSPDSGGLASFAELLPKILEFATGEQSAAGDPDMEELHQKLEAEKPGYMNSANDDHGSKIVMMIMGDPKGQSNGDDLLQDNDQPHDPLSEHEATALRPGLENTCPRCGSMTDPSSAHCPQCGMANPQHAPLSDPTMTDPVATAESYPTAHVAAGAATQGPVTDEQKAQVAELLQQEGRAEEIPTMILEPWNYADLLAQITGNEEPPQDIGQPGPPPPMNPAEQQGSMPMPGMGEGPQSGAQMQAAVVKYAASVDGFCEKCPNCGSHSTGYMDYEEGDAGCKTCGNTWKAKAMVKNSDVAAPQMGEANPIGVPAAEAEGQPDVEQEQDSSRSWTDESGAPLAVGQTYEMYSENYDIPDRIRIDAVKPDVIEYTLVGEYGLDHRTELTHEEASVENISFVPAGAEEAEPAPEENQGAQPMDPPPGQQTDLSTPHEMMTSKQADFDDTQGETTGGASEQGGIGPLNSHDITLAENESVDLDFDPHAQPSYDPKVAAFFDGDPAPQQTAPVAETDTTGPTWLMEGVPPSGSRVAGAHMTPWEQRDYIDETGDARNSDKLQLGGTHYEMDDLSDSFLFGL